MPRGTQAPACLLFGFRYGAITLYDATFQMLPLPNHRYIMPGLQPRRAKARRFGLNPVRSPLLGASRLISSPAGTEMFHFPAFAPAALSIQAEVTGHDSRRVSPFRYPRFNGCLAPTRGLSQPTASFFAFQRQGIRPVPLVTYHFKTHRDKTQHAFLSHPYQLSKNHGGLHPLTPTEKIALSRSEQAL